jgi:hypothetical protein
VEIFTGGRRMKKKFVLLIAFTVVSIGFISGCIQVQNWGWKKSTDPDDVMDFLNGDGPYSDPVDDAIICSIWKDTYPEYYIFYRYGDKEKYSEYLTIVREFELENKAFNFNYNTFEKILNKYPILKLLLDRFIENYTQK